MMKRYILLALSLFALVCLCAAGEGDFGAYLSMHDLPPASSEIEVTPSDYAAMEMAGAYAMEDGSLYTAGQGWVEYRVTAPESALYAVKLTYYPASGTGADIQRALWVNGSLPYDSMGTLSFSRMWNNRDDSYKTVKGNQPFPSQIETPQWREVWLKDSGGYVEGALTIALNEGENTLRLISRREDMILGKLTLCPPVKSESYEAYLQRQLDGGAQYYSGKFLKLQAEDAALKSGPSFYPLNDRTSPLTEPYHYSNIVRNPSVGPA